MKPEFKSWEVHDATTSRLFSSLMTWFQIPLAMSSDTYFAQSKLLWSRTIYQLEARSPVEWETTKKLIIYTFLIFVCKSHTKKRNVSWIMICISTHRSFRFLTRPLGISRYHILSSFSKVWSISDALCVSRWQNSRTVFLRKEDEKKCPFGSQVQGPLCRNFTSRDDGVALTEAGESGVVTHITFRELCQRVQVMVKSECA